MYEEHTFLLITFCSQFELRTQHTRAERLKLPLAKPSHRRICLPRGECGRAWSASSQDLRPVLVYAYTSVSAYARAHRVHTSPRPPDSASRTPRTVNGPRSLGPGIHVG